MKRKQDMSQPAGPQDLLSGRLRFLLCLLLVVVIAVCLMVMGIYIADPQSASPKELGIPTLLLVAVGALFLILVPWSKLGIRIKKIGSVEFEQVVLSQKREQAELLDSLSQRVEKLESAGSPSDTKTTTRPMHELDELLLKFFAKYPKIAFSPWRIQTWGSEREGFQRLRQYSRITVRHHLDRLLVEGHLRTTLSRKGNTLYMLAEQDGPNKAMDSDEE
ncbi:MAG: hypothetical protein R6T98_01350 [Desulfatiglandales bacterium]